MRIKVRFFTDTIYDDPSENCYHFQFRFSIHQPDLPVLIVKRLFNRPFATH